MGQNKKDIDSKTKTKSNLTRVKSDTPMTPLTPMSPSMISMGQTEMTHISLNNNIDRQRTNLNDEGDNDEDMYGDAIMNEATNATAQANGDNIPILPTEKIYDDAEEGDDLEDAEMYKSDNDVLGGMTATGTTQGGS